MPDAIVITGLGVASGLGLDPETTWRNVLAGRRGIGPMPAMESPLPPGSDGGQAPDLPADFAPAMPREARYLRWAITQATAQAGRFDSPPDRIAVMLGTTLHGMRAGGRFLRTGDFTQLHDFLAGGVLRAALTGLPVHGGRATTCSACSSGLGAIALAATILHAGEADVVIAGGYDPASEYAWAGFNSLRLVSGPHLRPFARDRVGMKTAEAYAVLVMERAADARRRGATVVATVAGYGESADAHHLTQPRPDGRGAAAAMREAIAAAGLTPNDIGLAAAHATGTPDNDAAEFAALSATFGGRLPRVPVVAFKGHLGHTLGGAGAIELILSALALRDGVVPPTVLDAGEVVDFEGLNLIRGGPKPAAIRATLNTSLGFGGANTSVVLTSAGAPVGGTGVPPVFFADTGGTPVPPFRAVVVTGVGVILPGVYDRDALRDLPTTARGPIDMTRVEAHLNARRVRRMSDYVKLTLAAVAIAGRDAFGDAGVPADSAAVLGTTHGSANFCETYYRQLIDEGVTAANPLLFAEGVPNAAAAQLSLMLGLVGPCQTIVGTHTAGLDAVRLAMRRLACGAWDRCVVSAGEETSRIVAEAYTACGAGPADDTVGAAALVLESADAAAARGARVLATLADAAAASGDTAVGAFKRVRRALPPADRVAPPAVAAGRFSVTPLATLAALAANGIAGVVIATDPTGLAAGVRLVPSPVVRNGRG